MPSLLEEVPGDWDPVFFTTGCPAQAQGTAHGKGTVCIYWLPGWFADLSGHLTTHQPQEWNYSLHSVHSWLCQIRGLEKAKPTRQYSELWLCSKSQIEADRDVGQLLPSRGRIRTALFCDGAGFSPRLGRHALLGWALMGTLLKSAAVR